MLKFFSNPIWPYSYQCKLLSLEISQQEFQEKEL